MTSLYKQTKTDKTIAVNTEQIKNRPIEELFVEKYYGLDAKCSPKTVINTDYNDVVNILAMFHQEYIPETINALVEEIAKLQKELEKEKGKMYDPVRLLRSKHY